MNKKNVSQTRGAKHLLVKQSKRQTTFIKQTSVEEYFKEPDIPGCPILI